MGEIMRRETDEGSANSLLYNDLPRRDLSTPVLSLSLPLFLGRNIQPNRRELFPLPEHFSSLSSLEKKNKD